MARTELKHQIVDWMAKPEALGDKTRRAIRKAFSKEDSKEIDHQSALLLKRMTAEDSTLERAFRAHSRNHADRVALVRTVLEEIHNLGVSSRPAPVAASPALVTA